MLALTVVLLAGLAMAVFATQNTAGVDVTVLNSVLPSVPLYAVVIASMLIGILFSAILSLFDAFESLFALRKKDSTIANRDHSINDLERKVEHLETENDRLRDQINRLNPSLKERILAHI